MLETYFNLFEFVYNNIYYYYYIYIIIYKLKLHLGFYFHYWCSLFLYYIQSNKIVNWIFSPIFKLNFNLNKAFIWFNRRFLKKRKRFRVYYKFHNIRYWKFILFFFYLNAFIIMWQRRNLYTKTQLLAWLVFLHIGILISLHFFLGLFISYDIAVLFCIFFFFVWMLFFNK